MITQYAIGATEWTPISNAGQYGSCWLDEDGDGSAGTVDVRIVHSDSGVPVVGATLGKRVWKPSGNSDLLIITADSSSDIFYARAMRLGDAATLSVDVV
jgi:hypothetical protein